MRVQPGLTVIAPADPAPGRRGLNATWDLPGPIYFRLGRTIGRSFPAWMARSSWGRIEQLHDGRDVAIVTTGAISGEALAAADAIRDAGIDARSWSSRR